MTPSNREIRRVLDAREESARRTFAVGHIKGEDVEIAQLCMYCEAWLTGEPTGPYVVSHGLCQDCLEEHYPDLSEDE